MKNLLILSLLSFVLVWSFGCSSKPVAEMNDTVKIQYVAEIEDGTIIDSTITDSSLTLTIGEGKAFPTLEEAIIGMSVGDTATVTLPPDKGFGNRRDELVGKVPRSAFPDTVDLKVGMSWQVPSGNGMFYASIVGLEKDSVIIDSNHPLAGETIKYHIEVVDIRKAE